MLTLIAAFAVALLWLSTTARADEACASHDKVLSDSEWAIPNATHKYLGREQTARLLYGAKREYRVPSKLESDSALVFASPTAPNYLVVLFNGICVRGQFPIPPDVYSRIMEGVSI